MSKRELLAAMVALFLIAVFLPLAVLVGLIPADGKQQDSEDLAWSQPVNLSEGLSGNPLFPYISARRGGGALLVWSQTFVDTAMNEDEIFFREFDGSQWSPLENISNSPSFSGSPMVVSDRHGAVHAIWLEDLRPLHAVTPFGYSDIFSSERKGSVWSPGKSIYHTNERFGMKPGGMNFVVDNHDGLHLVWTNPEAPTVLYSRKTTVPAPADQWTVPRPIFRGGMADIAVDATDRLHIVVVHTLGISKGASPVKVNDLFYSYSVDGGRSWAQRSVVHDSGREPAFFPKLVVDRTQTIHVLWAKDETGDLFPDDILHSFSVDGMNWSVPESITRQSSGNSFPPSVGVDASNCIHAVWWWTPYFGSRSAVLYYARRQLGRWTEPVRLFEEAIYPSLCVDEVGILHLAWVRVRQVDQGRRNTAILYSQARTDPESVLPESYRLYPNRPNPFNAQTVIGYWLPQPERVRLRVYDLLGRQIAVLVDGVESGGRHEVTFDGSWLPSGVYFYALEVGSDRLVRKMAVVR